MAHLRCHFVRGRGLSCELVAGLSDVDAGDQSVPDASPSRGLLAHTTWFFETFVLRGFVCGYRPFDPAFAFIYNSYHDTEGDRLARTLCGMLARPLLDEVLAYHSHFDPAPLSVLDNLATAAQQLVLLGCNREKQHQELLLTDLLHLFAQNALLPITYPSGESHASAAPGTLCWIEGRYGPADIGHDGVGFAFDCEQLRHTEWPAPHALADQLVTNGEWCAFIEDGGYAGPNFWLSDGWTWVRQNGIEALMYWRRETGGDWSQQFGLDCPGSMDSTRPVQRVSYYEADALARWAGGRLPSEAEYECAAEDPHARCGTFLDRAGAVSPPPVSATGGVRQMFGHLLEWTGSVFLTYPGFHPAPGAVGEYNGNSCRVASFRSTNDI